MDRKNEESLKLLMESMDKRSQMLVDPNYKIVDELYAFLPSSFPIEWEKNGEGEVVVLLPISIPKNILEAIELLPPEYSKDKVRQNLVSSVFFRGLCELVMDNFMLNGLLKEKRKGESKNE